MISEHITRNTCYFIFFNQADAESVYHAVKILQIDERNARLISSLGPGTCIVRQTQSSWSIAFLAEIDFIPPARNISNIEYSGHCLTPTTDENTNDKIIMKLEQSIKQSESKPENKSDIEIASLKLITLWVNNPYAPVARLFERLGNFHYTIQIKIREFIEQKKWAEFAEARIGKTNILLMELSEKGYNILQVQMPKGNKGRGGIIHRHYAMWIKSYYEKRGYKAYLECIVPNTKHPTDVAVTFENNLEIFEISVSATDNLVSHIDVFEKNPNIKKLTIITGTKTELAEIKKLIKNNLLLARFENRIELNVIENYMEKDKK